MECCHGIAIGGSTPETGADPNTTQEKESWMDRVEAPLQLRAQFEKRP